MTSSRCGPATIACARWRSSIGGHLANLVGAGGVHDTIEVLRDAAATLAGAGDDEGEAKAHHVIAGAHALLGEVAAAEAALDSALVAARRPATTDA